MKRGRESSIHAYLKLATSVVIVAFVTTLTSCENRHGSEATCHNSSDSMKSTKKTEGKNVEHNQLNTADTLISRADGLTENPWNLPVKEYITNRTFGLEVNSCTKEIIELIDSKGKFLYVVEINDPAQADVGPLRGYVENQAIINRFIIPGEDKWGAIKRAGIELKSLTKNRNKSYMGKPLPTWVIRCLYADNYWSLAFDCPLIDRETLLQMYPYLSELDKPASQKPKAEEKTVIEKPKIDGKKTKTQSSETSNYKHGIIRM